MGVLADHQIEKEVKIVPMFPCEKKEGTISNGITSYGYDATLGYTFRVPTPHRCTGMVLDPKNPSPKAFETVELFPGHDYVTNRAGKVWCQNCEVYQTEAEQFPEYAKCQKTGHPNFIVIPANSMVLGETVEEFTIPRDVLCVVLGKSTYARNGILINVTPGEPEWTGKWTVEISNTCPLPVKVYTGEGIMQCIFHRSDGALEATLWTLVQHIAMTAGDSAEYLIRSLYEQLQRPMHSLVSPIMLIPRGTCQTSYKDKKGKYQGQEGLTLSKADERGTK